MRHTFSAVLASATTVFAGAPAHAALISAPLIAEIHQSNEAGNVPDLIGQTFDSGLLEWDDTPGRTAMFNPQTGSFALFFYSFDLFGSTLDEDDANPPSILSLSPQGTDPSLPQSLSFTMDNPGVSFGGASVTQVQAVDFITPDEGEESYIVKLSVDFDGTPQTGTGPEIIPLPATGLLLLGGVLGLGFAGARRRRADI